MDRLEQMFAKKRESTRRFRTVQWNLGAFSNQSLIDRADPATREGCIELHKGLHWINLELYEFISAKPEDAYEELADVAHFLLEFCILAGFDETVVPHPGDPSLDRLDMLFNASKRNPLVFNDSDTNARFTLVAALSVADLLKNKPWKQSLKPVPDPDPFVERVGGIWYWFGATCRTASMTPQQLFENYMRKEDINANRIATGV